jgi:hypothetical protein
VITASSDAPQPVKVALGQVQKATPAALERPQDAAAQEAFRRAADALREASLQVAAGLAEVKSSPNFPGNGGLTRGAGEPGRCRGRGAERSGDQRGVWGADGRGKGAQGEGCVGVGGGGQGEDQQAARAGRRGRSQGPRRAAQAEPPEGLVGPGGRDAQPRGRHQGCPR